MHPLKTRKDDTYAISLYNYIQHIRGYTVYTDDMYNISPSPQTFNGFLYTLTVFLMKLSWQETREEINILFLNQYLIVNCWRDTSDKSSRGCSVLMANILHKIHLPFFQQ